MRPVFWLPLLLLLAACGPGTKLGTIAGGECHLTHTPEYAVAGKAQRDQNWIDDTTESLVQACNQPRPKPRPASFDKKPVKAISAKPKKKWLPSLSRTPTIVPKPPVANEPPEPKDLPPMHKADPLWPPVKVPPEPPKQLDPPAQPQPVPPPTQRDWWYYLRR